MGRKHFLAPDLWITLPVVFLLSLGVLVIYSSDSRLALQQGSLALVGLFLFWVLSFIDINAYGPYARYLYPVAILLLLLVFILGVEARGSIRWIQIGPLQFQPSEFIKPVLILFLARFWSTRYPSWRNIGLSLLLILPALGLIFKQPDLGTALTLGMIWLMTLVGANVSAFKFVLMGVFSAILMPVMWMMMKDYQKARILTFLSPKQDPLGMGYNVIQSVIAVGSGQWGGRGLGRGTQSRLQFLPEFRTDFVFASIAEEFGFVGSVLVLILYGTLLGKIVKVAQCASDKFSSLVVWGVLGMLFFQITVNIGMNIGVVPVTGITLPLLSAGGSSIISTLVCLGFVASVSRFGGRSRLPIND